MLSPGNVLGELSPFKLLENNKKSFDEAMAVLRSDGSFEQKCEGIIKAATPQVPNIDGLPQLRDRVVDNKYLPPLPTFIGKYIKGD